MTIAITPERQELVAAVKRFVDRHAQLADTRSALDELSEGHLPAWWKDLVDNGFHAVHLDEQVGGQGGGRTDMACVLAAAAEKLLPGPLLGTAIAGAVVSAADPTEAARVLLKEIAGGLPATVVLPGHSDFRMDADGRITGSSGLTQGICSAQRVVVPARTADRRSVWAVVDPAGCPIDRRRGTDPTVDLGILHLNHHAGAVLSGVDEDTVLDITVAFTAAMTSGILQWCVGTVTDHLRTREQFGALIGTFQAMQHKAAMLLVTSELAAAAAWDAARALDESDEPEQRRLASAAAAVMTVMPAPGHVLEALTMLGAIGFTWEHDLHLYWRRATSLAASIGPVSRWTRELGELSAVATRDLNVHLGVGDAGFRAEVAGVLDAALSVANDADGRQGEGPEYATGAQRKLLADQGLVAPHWPAPWGRDATVRQQLIVAEEFGRRPALVRPSIGIAEWILPSILTAGSDDVREQFVTPTLRGELAWCQLFSEPGAGSDLASLVTRAERTDGGWLVNGHKIWTSSAHRADYGALLARTDPAAPKHRGIGYFILDMRSPGVEYQQITQASGRADFNEVFLTDVFIPDAMLLGEPTGGWQLAISTMAAERVAISGYVHHDRMGALRQLVADGGADRDPMLHAIGEIDAYTNTLKALGLRETLRLLDGQAPGTASSISKVATNVMLRRAAALTLGLTGRLGLEQHSEPPVVAPYLDLPAELIGGGTTEIQLNIIAQMIMGLPRK